MSDEQPLRGGARSLQPRSSTPAFPFAAKAALILGAFMVAKHKALGRREESAYLGIDPSMLKRPANHLCVDHTPSPLPPFLLQPLAGMLAPTP